MTDIVRGETVDATGNAYVLGATNSLNFPVVDAYQGSLGGSPEDDQIYQREEIGGFLTMIDPTGSEIVFSTFLGGSGVDNSAGCGHRCR